MSGCGADSDLNQTVRQTLFHDSCKWRCVRPWIALEVVVDVGVGVEMQNRQPGMSLAHNLQQRVCNGMIAAEEDCRAALPNGFIGVTMNLAPGIRRSLKLDVPTIAQPT